MHLQTAPRVRAPTAQQAANPSTWTATMVDPTGVPARIAMTIPVKEHTTERTAEQMVTCRKLRNIRIAERAGKMTRAEIRSEPTRFGF